MLNIQLEQFTAKPNELTEEEDAMRLAVLEEFHSPAVFEPMCPARCGALMSEAVTLGDSYQCCKCGHEYNY